MVLQSPLAFDMLGSSEQIRLPLPIMSICPWCKGQMPSANEVCPLCGKKPHEHPSISSGNYASFEAFDDFEEPEEGGLHVAGAVEPLARSQGPDIFGGDSFEDAPTAGNLKLEVEQVPRAVPQKAPVAAPPSGPVPDVMPAAKNYRDPMPDQQEAPAFDPFEIAVLADYGPAPAQIWQFPPYAIRVTARRRDLRRRLAMSRRAVDDAERQRDDRLADLAERVRPAVEQSNDMESLLDTLRQIEETAASRNQALSARNQELAQKVSVVDREIEGHRKHEQETQAKVKTTAATLDAARQELERANAARKRAEIELRNAQEVARAAAGPQARTAPPEHAAKLQHLQEILDERKAAASAPQAAFDEAKRVWNDADSAHKAVQRKIADLQKQRRHIEQSYASDIGMRSAGVEEAQKERRAALVAIGARLIEMNAEDVPRKLRQTFFEAQDVLSARVLEADKLEQAIVSADPAAVRKGWVVMGGGGFVALVLLVALVALFGRTEPDPLYDSFRNGPPRAAPSRLARIDGVPPNEEPSSAQTHRDVSAGPTSAERRSFAASGCRA